MTDRAEIGGAERRLIDLAKYLDPQRFKLAFCTLAPAGPLLDELRTLGHDTYSLGVGRGADYPGAIVEAMRLVRRLRPAVLHAQVRYAAFVGAVVGRLCRVPVVLATRTYTTRLGGHPFLDRVTSRLVDSTVAVSRAAREVMLVEERVKPERVRLIENGVDLSDFTTARASRPAVSRASLGLGDGPVVGTVGNLHAIKGHECLVDAMADVRARVPGARLLLVGDGSLRPSLERRAAGLGLADAVVFAGFRADVPALLALMDVFVLPSLNEGMSHALLEAMALGRPVVATAVGGNREVIADGVSGVLVPASDAAALGDAVASLLSDPGRAPPLAARARETVEARFSARRMVAAYAGVYEELLAARSPAASGA